MWTVLNLNDNDSSMMNWVLERPLQLCDIPREKPSTRSFGFSISSRQHENISELNLKFGFHVKRNHFSKKKMICFIRKDLITLRTNKIDKIMSILSDNK